MSIPRKPSRSRTWLFTIALALVSALGAREHARADVTNEEWSKAYEYLAQLSGHYYPQTRLAQRKEIVLNAFLDGQRHKFSPSSPEDERVIKNWAQRSQIVAWVSDFDSHFRTVANDVAKQLGIASNELSSYIDEYQLVVVMGNDLYGGFGNLTFDRALFAEDDATITFALLHELGHNLGANDTFHDAILSITPKSDNELHREEFIADAFAAKWMQLKFKRQEILTAAQYLFLLEGQGDPEFIAHPPSDARTQALENILK